MPTSKTIVITGGSGYLGTTLAQTLTDSGYRVVVVSRSSGSKRDPWEHRTWDGRSVGEWASALDGASAVVNLAGRSVDCIKTPEHCDEILRSRVESTLAIGSALKQVSSPPNVWLQMSTAHIYGDSQTVLCTESSPTGYGLAPFVGHAWENAFSTSMLPGMRGVILRTSFVMGRNAGPLPKLALVARMGLGGRIGSGKQGISWIHELDMMRLFVRGIEDETMHGVYMCTAPIPVSQVEFMKRLRRALKMPIGLPAYSWMVKIGARLFLRTDPELALYGRYCKSERLEHEGFQFKFPTVESALENIYAR